MRMMSSIALCLALASGAASASAGSGSYTQSGLYDENDINQGLLVIAVADKIRRSCDSIRGRLFTARSYVNGLKDVAVSRGYSDDEIDSYINDSDGKAEMRLRRNAYFESKGASNLDHESLCVLGRAEIARQSQIGKLLKAK